MTHKILISFWAKPGPVRGFDWSATFYDYDGAPDSSNRNMVGYGHTEEEAIDDLKRLHAEMADCAEADAENKP